MSAVLQPVSGPGVVSRRGDLVVLTSAPPGSEQVVDALLAAQEDVARAGGDGDALTDRLGGVLSGTQIPLDVVALGPTAGALTIAVQGHVFADVVTEHRQQRLALQPGQGIRTTAAGRLVSVQCGFGEPVALAPSRFGRLEQGVVSAGGFVLQVTATGSAPDDQASAGAAANPTMPGPSPAPTAGPVEPALPDQPEVQSAPESDAAVEVLGIYCGRGHFNDPGARFCALCDAPMSQPGRLEKGPRPPLGVLVLDDGSRFTLDKDHIVGRDPSLDPDVVSGAARPLRIDDQHGALSRVHARIRLNDWQVEVVDLGSPNGTGVWRPGEASWTRVPPNTAHPVGPGMQIGVGRNQLRFEARTNP